LKDERTGTREKPFTGFDPLDEGVPAGFYTFFLAVGNDPTLHSVSFVIAEVASAGGPGQCVVQVPRRLARTVFFRGGEAAGGPGPVLRPTPVVALRPRVLSLIGGASIEANDAADRVTAVSMHASILKV